MGELFALRMTGVNPPLGPRMAGLNPPLALRMIGVNLGLARRPTWMTACNNPYCLAIV